MCLEDLAHLLLLLLGRTSRHARALSKHWAEKPDRRVVEFVQRLRTSGGEGSGGSAVAAAGAAVGTDLAQPLTLPKAAVQALAFNLVQVGDLVRVCPDEQEVQRSHRSYARGIGTNSGMLRDCGAVLPVRDSKVVHRSPVLLVSNSASVKEGNTATSPPTSSASRALAALLPSSSSSSVYMWNPKLLTVMCRKADIPRYRHLFAAKSSSSPSLLLQPHETLSAAETDSAVSCFLAVATSFASASSCGPSPWSFEGNVSDSDLGRLFALFERRHLAAKTAPPAPSDSHETSNKRDRSTTLLAALLDLACAPPITTRSSALAEEDDESKTEEGTSLQESKAEDGEGEEGGSTTTISSPLTPQLMPRLELLLTRFGVREVLRSLVEKEEEEDVDDEQQQEGQAPKLSEASRLLSLIGHSLSTPSATSVDRVVTCVARISSISPDEDVSATHAGGEEKVAAALEELAGLLNAPRGNTALGITHHELVSKDVAGALLVWLQGGEGRKEWGANSRAAPRGRAFLDCFLAIPPPKTSPTSLSSEADAEITSPSLAQPSVEDSPMVKLVRRLQTVCAAESTLAAYVHRNASDIVETASKAVEIKLRFRPGSVEAAEAEGEEAAGTMTSSSHPAAAAAAAIKNTATALVASTVKATRTADVGDVVAHVLRSMPVTSLPAPYVKACRELVGMLVRERFAKALAPRGIASSALASSSGNSSSSGGSGGRSTGVAKSLLWRNAVVVAYDENLGAHQLRYLTAEERRHKHALFKVNCCNQQPNTFFTPFLVVLFP
jgi:hypothetical protein